MIEQDEIGLARKQKLEQLAGLGLPYLPNRYGPVTPSAEIRNEYTTLEGSTVRVAGRLMRVRLMGKAAFAHIQDAAGQIQLYFKRDVLGPEQWDYFKLLDVGDIIGAEGTVFQTKTGEVSVQVQHLVLLAKSYRPMPDKYHGLADVETRYRRRYLDLIANEDTRRIFRLRADVIRSFRRTLDERGFVEVETPILQPIYGGAAATPFTTEYHALDATMYLRIATELYLKRLIVGGMDRVYEIGKDFRNEGLSRKHNPEFTMIEIYWAYVDYNDIMDLAETLIVNAAQSALGTLLVPFGDHEINLTPPWRRLTIADALREYAALDIEQARDREALLQAAQERQVRVAADATRGKIVEELVSALVEPHLIQPTFLIDFPVDFPGSLLAKRKPEAPDIAERFELYMGAMELGNAFTELNEPEDQRRRMVEAAAMRGEEYHDVDEDFLMALEYGMPPTGGIGIGIDRLLMIFANAHHIREVILFPTLRPEASRAES